MPLLGREPGTQVFRDLVENPADETLPGIAVLRLDGGLFFATAEALEDRVRGLRRTANAPARSSSTSKGSTSSTRRARRR
jgi:MFS superfamily sulfate permease-like transporter